MPTLVAVVDLSFEAELVELRPKDLGAGWLEVRFPLPAGVSTDDPPRLLVELSERVEPGRRLCGAVAVSDDRLLCAVAVPGLGWLANEKLRVD